MRPPEFLLFQADALRLPMKPKSVHCVVSSPPYYNLRSYETAKWIGGDPACSHEAPLEGGKSGNKGQYQRHAGRFAGPACYRCGAQRIDRQIGLEADPSSYVAALVAAFAEVHRVLRDDGVLWINISSSYAGSWGNQGRKLGRGTQRPINGPMIQNLEPYPDKGSNTGTIPEGSSLKPKDLIFIPAMLALELQKWGWYLRSDVIWEKRNAMPSSVQDRPSLSHEYVFMLTKKSRYFYDGDAVRQPLARTWDAETNGGSLATTRHHESKIGGSNRHERPYPEPNPLGGNCRSVWTFNVGNFPGSHYAVMSPELAERCIKAGTSQAGCCPKCGAPYRRVVERVGEIPQTERRKRLISAHVAVAIDNGSTRHHSSLGAGSGGDVPLRERRTLGWTPGCKCDAGAPVPCRVFDPFGGVATTALVAVGLGRDGIACDLSAKYLRMGKRRIERPHAPVQRAPNPNRPEKPTPLFKDDDE